MVACWRLLSTANLLMQWLNTTADTTAEAQSVLYPITTPRKLHHTRKGHTDTPHTTT